MRIRFFRRKSKNEDKTSSLVSGRNSSQRVFSYYTASHNQLNKLERRTEASGVSEQIARRHRTLRKNWFLLLGMIILFGSGLYMLTLSATPRVVVEGTKYRSSADYQKLVGAELKKNILNLTKPTLQRSQLSDELAKLIPEAKTISVSSQFLGRHPNIIITTDEPSAVLTQTNDQDLLISQRGRLLLSKEQSTNTTDLTIISNQSGVTGKAGEQFFRPDDMKALLSLMQQVKLDNSKASFILKTEPREITMLEQSRGAYEVKFLLGDTMLQQYGSLRAVQKKLQTLKQTPSQYIDVRLSNKVFYQ